MTFALQSVCIAQQEEIKIRLAKPEDSSQITALQVLSITLLSSQHYSASQIQALVEDKSRKRAYQEIIFVAELQNRIVGFSAISFLWNITLITAVFVHPDLIRRGIGTRLLMQLEQEALQAKRRSLMVTASLNGQPFYEANGYVPLESRSIQLNSGETIPCVAMHKSLKSHERPKPLEIRTLILLIGAFALFFLGVNSKSHWCIGECGSANPIQESTLPDGSD
jgi:putative acetyltransferase